MTPGSGGGIHGAGSTVITRLAIGGPGQPIWLEIDRRNILRPWLWIRRAGAWRRALPELVQEPLPLEVVAWLARDVAPLVGGLAFVRPQTGLALGSWCFVRLPAADVLCGVEVVRTDAGIGLVGFAQPWFVPGDQFETLLYGGAVADPLQPAASGVPETYARAPSIEGSVPSAGSAMAPSRALADGVARLENRVESNLGSPDRFLRLPPVGVHDELYLYLEDLELRAYGHLWLGRTAEARRYLDVLARLRDSRWYTDDERRAVEQARDRAVDVRGLLEQGEPAARARLRAWHERHRAAWT